MAGLLSGTYSFFDEAIGLGKLSRLRVETVSIPQLASMNFRIETWSSILVRDVAGLRVGRDCDQRDTCAVAEVIEWLYVTGIVVAATFVERHEDHGVFPQLRICLHCIDDLLGEAFEQVKLGGRGVTIGPGPLGFTMETAGSLPS